MDCIGGHKEPDVNPNIRAPQEILQPLAGQGVKTRMNLENCFNPRPHDAGDKKSLDGLPNRQ